MSGQEQGPRASGGPTFRRVTDRDFYEDIPLKGRPEFAGGILKSDSLEPEGTMDIETKEIKRTPSTERKDEEVKSGARKPCTDKDCPYAGSWHVHE
jgi:hypothetical protein